MQNGTTGGLTPIEASLTALCAQAVFGAEPVELAGADLEQIRMEAERQAVFPLVYQALTQHGEVALPPAWKARFRKHLAHNQKVINLHDYANALLTECGIPYTVIKGCASGYYYALPELRTMGDVDLYVDQSNLERVRELYTTQGYAFSNLHHSHHWTFTREGEVVEVHWLPSGVPASDDGRIAGLFMDLIDQRFFHEANGCAMYLPDPFHHGLMLLLHTANHLSAGGIGLRHLLDWLVYVSGFSEQTFRDRMEETLRRVGLWQFARVLTAIGVRFFSCEPRAFCRDVSEELALALLRDIFAGGNFGVKDSGRLLEAKLLRDERTREIDGKNGAVHLVRFLNRKAQLALPITKKLPVLLPVGWCKVGLTHLRESRHRYSGGISLRRLTRGARDREALYRQLQLFEK